MCGRLMQFFFSFWSLRWRDGDVVMFLMKVCVGEVVMVVCSAGCRLKTPRGKACGRSRGRQTTTCLIDDTDDATRIYLDLINVDLISS
jgi:hypothetical protein